MDRGEFAAAADRFARLAPSTDPQVGGIAHLNLAFIALMSGRPVDDMRAHLDAASATEAPALQAMVAAIHGKADMDAGDFAAAEAEFDRVLTAAEVSPPIRAIAQANLGEIRFQRDDVAGARLMLQAAVDSGMVAAVLPAKLTLARMAMGEDDEQADALLTEVARTGDAQSAPMARLLLLLLHEVPDGAVPQLEELGRSPVVAVAHLADVVLAMELRDRGETAVAEAHLQRPLASPVRRVRVHALVVLGDLLADTDPPAAERHWRAALAEGDAAWSSEAAIRLARRADDITSATELYRRAEDIGDRGTATKAADLAGDLLAGHADLDGARAAYRRAILRDDPRWSMQARLDLAVLEVDPAVTRPPSRRCCRK